MLLADLPAQLKGEFDYPVTLETVMERMGSVEVESHDCTDPATVGSILEPLAPDTFDSPEMLYETIYGTVGDEHIGRKYYDDRGGDHTTPDEGPRDDENVSF